MRQIDNICYQNASTKVIETCNNDGYRFAGMTPGEIIRSKRESLGLSQLKLAEAVGISQPAIKKIEDGATVKSKHLPRIAQFLSIPLENLDPSLAKQGRDLVASDRAPAPVDERENAKHIPNARMIGPVPMSRRKIPVYGHAAGGDDGRFILNGEKLDEVYAAPSLEAVPDAYAIYVHGESMVPRYESGETVHIHPTRPVRSGDYVVVQLRTDDENEMAGFVKRFVSRNSKELVVSQFNPPREIRYPAADVVSVHKIVAAGEF